MDRINTSNMMFHLHFILVRGLWQSYVDNMSAISDLYRGIQLNNLTFDQMIQINQDFVKSFAICETTASTIGANTNYYYRDFDSEYRVQVQCGEVYAYLKVLPHCKDVANKTNKSLSAKPINFNGTYR